LGTRRESPRGCHRQKTGLGLRALVPKVKLLEEL
jgi:hypothetical protein